MEHRAYHSETIVDAGNAVDVFSSYLWDAANKQLKDTTEEDLSNYLLHLEARKLKPGTRNIALCHLRRFFSFCLKERILLKDPAQNIFPLRRRYLPKEVPDTKTIEYLLELPAQHTYEGLRDRAIFELLYSTGLRNKELRDLLLRDIDLKERSLQVRLGKGSKGRTLPLGKKAALWLGRYLEVTRPHYVKRLEEDHLYSLL